MRQKATLPTASPKKKEEEKNKQDDGKKGSQGEIAVPAPPKIVCKQGMPCWDIEGTDWDRGSVGIGTDFGVPGDQFGDTRDPIINCDEGPRTAGSCADGVAAVDPSGNDPTPDYGDPPPPSAYTCNQPNSFVSGTKVLMADGRTKAIEDVKIGDRVIATDPRSGRTEAEPVTALITGEGNKHLVKLTIDVDGPAGTATSTITATSNHPFWVPAMRLWVDAGRLQPGMWLQTSAGTYVQIAAIAVRTAVQQVHNLTIDDLHTYHVVAGDQAILVHNDNPLDEDAWPGIVWKALAHGEDPALGLTARDPNAIVTPLSHVAGKRKSPWISTSKLPSVAFDKYNQGNGVVAIDLSKIPGAVVDVSPGSPGKGRIDSYAKKDQEVLIHGYIPSDAIVGCWD
ncbi:polymorphic toxin-type HINT domain-containing protein [Nonomuraea sp. NPDC049758]|uniref:polymorphic toxin-type HINT domain-containing protein n=1 Tax=Nonomuraea sp. NPDC049758 TaxID=3154360 RepID=UPI00344A408C